MALARDGAIVFEHREAARLTMRAFSDGFLESYLDAMGGAVTASVGGYQLEKAGVQLFERIDGDHFVDPRIAVGGAARLFAAGGVSGAVNCSPLWDI